MRRGRLGNRCLVMMMMMMMMMVMMMMDGCMDACIKFAAYPFEGKAMAQQMRDCAFLQQQARD